MRDIFVVAHDMRSAHNVGSLLRTCEGLGVKKVWLTGYTPYPKIPGDSRLPHLAAKIDKQIDKTALGAAESLAWEYCEDVDGVLNRLKTAGVTIAALEQTKSSVSLHEFDRPNKVALLLGNEVDGLNSDLLSLASVALEIPMYGQKESFNVVQAAAMALYELRFH